MFTSARNTERLASLFGSFGAPSSSFTDTLFQPVSLGDSKTNEFAYEVVDVAPCRLVRYKKRRRNLQNRLQQAANTATDGLPDPEFTVLWVDGEPPPDDRCTVRASFPAPHARCALR